MHDAQPGHDPRSTTAPAPSGRAVPRILHRVALQGDAAGDQSFATWTERHPGWEPIVWEPADLERLDRSMPPERAWRTVLTRFGGAYVAAGVPCRRSLDDVLGPATLAVGRAGGRLAVVVAAPGDPAIAVLTADDLRGAATIDDVVDDSPAAATPAAGLCLAVDLRDAASRQLGVVFVGHVARRFRGDDGVALRIVAHEDDALPALLEALADTLYGLDDALPIDLVSADELGTVDLLYRPGSGADAPRRLLDAIDVVDQVGSRVRS